MIAEPTERVQVAERTYPRENAVRGSDSRPGPVGGAPARLRPLNDRRTPASGPVLAGVTASPRAMGKRRTRGVAGHAKERPVLCAVLAASFCVMTASLYLSEYARVADDGLQQAKLTKAIRQARQERDSLNAEMSALTLPSMVRARAEQMGMVPNASQSADLVAGTTVTAAPASAP